MICMLNLYKNYTLSLKPNYFVSLSDIPFILRLKPLGRPSFSPLIPLLDLGGDSWLSATHVAEVEGASGTDVEHSVAAEATQLEPFVSLWHLAPGPGPCKWDRLI